MKVLAGLLVLACLCTPAQARAYPCWKIKAYVWMFGRAAAEELGRQNHVTPKEHAAAEACLSAKPKKK